MDVEQVITELYGLRPTQFTAARDGYVARARQEKSPEAACRIAALRKPTLALWSAGLFARERPADAAAFLRLGGRLRTAHRELDGARLRVLSHERHRVIGALARESVQLAGEVGERVSESVLREIEQIFHALLVDEGAGRRWLAGRLTSAPTVRVGFEGVAPGPGAVPSSPATASRTPPAPSTQPPAAVRDAVAERRAREHERRLEAARHAEAEATAAHEQALTELAEAATVLERARGEAAAVREELHTVLVRLEAAEKAAAAAASRHHRVEAAAKKTGQAAESATRRFRDARWWVRWVAVMSGASFLRPAQTR
ncbi:hypothetical protein [Streptomyces sp. NPDC089915]|uniref:hypothetical protein n=1 Tax=Streptomyces sp. NPDC089915 TaxID=3155186 RepID=UPI00342521EE